LKKEIKNNMSEANKVVLPVIGQSENSKVNSPHVSIDIINAQLATADENTKNLDQGIQKLEAELMRARTNKTAVYAQKLVLEEVKKQILELIPKE